MKNQIAKMIGWMMVLIAMPGLAADLKGPYLGQKPPGMKPEIFAPGVISVEGTTERSLALSPNGDELFFTRSSGWPHSKIMHMRKQGDTWSLPEPASFVKDDGATQPVFSADGQYLYFSSNHGKSDVRYFSLFRSKKQADGWSEPEGVVDMGGGLMMEFHPSVARNGSVYFLYWDFLKEPEQLGDLYVAELKDGKYAEPVLLGPPVSTEYNEVRPTVDPDEKYLLFESNRPGGYGETDIYVAFGDSDGAWSTVRNLGPTVNTAGVDDTPNISPDGKYWFSSIDGDIYWRQTPTALLEPNAGGNEKAEEKGQLAPADNVPEITYIANNGFLIEAAGKKVLIDALFDPVFKRFLAPSAETIRAMTEGEAPFADLDVILVTHPHADHFDPARVVACLRSHRRCQLVAHAETVARLRQTTGFAQIEGQINEVNLEPGAIARVRINDIPIVAICLDHMHDQDRPLKNLAFIITLGDKRFLHPGDAVLQQNTAYLDRFPFDDTPIDLLFVDYFDRSQTTQQFIARKIKPSRIIAMHVPPAEWEEEVDKIGAAYPQAAVFQQSLERRSLPIEIDFHTLTGDYLGQPPPGATPQVFARGIVSTDYLEHSAPAFSPDGNEVFWWLNRPPRVRGGKWRSPMMMTMRRVGGFWTAPMVVPYLGEPEFSLDGQRLYFTYWPSADVKNVGPFFVERRDDGWSEPESVGLVTRFPELQFAHGHSIARDGTLYFVGYAPGPRNDYGIYRTELVKGEYGKPELLPRNVNLPPFLNWTPFIAPDESYLLFSSNRRDPDHDAGDLYISRRLPDGGWTDPVALAGPVNTGRQERFPMLSPDGKYLFFTRWTPNHDQDVYWVSAKAIPELQKGSD